MYQFGKRNIVNSLYKECSQNVEPNLVQHQTLRHQKKQRSSPIYICLKTFTFCSFRHFLF